MSICLRIGGGSEDWEAILTLLHESFAYMDGRIDPPSSLARWLPATIADEAAEGFVIIGEDAGQIIACAFAKPRGDALYLGKIAVAQPYRGQGLLRQMIAIAAAEAQRRDMPELHLQSRIELADNHAAFAALGFVEVARTAHEGYDRATSITMRKRL